MTFKIRIYRSGGLVKETFGEKGDMLLGRICLSGVFLDAPCGGKGRCGKCLVRLCPDGEEILACRTYINSDMDVYLPDEMEMVINSQFTIHNSQLSDSSRNLRSANNADSLPSSDNSEFRIPNSELRPARPLGVAIDIGTTTVVAHLHDLGTGERIRTASGVNAQRAFGADVISRIQYCAENGHETLTRIVREQIASLIEQTCIMSGEKSAGIEFVSIAANTIMQHLAAGYSPVGMGVVPFTPKSLFGYELPAWEGLPAAEFAKVYFTPAISSYVGGDITAGMLAAGIHKMAGPLIYLDIGTNGEIALKSGDTYYCCATAAGPAFEGAEITMGMASVAGAINHVKWDGGLKLSVIGDGTPLGLCGSGLIDTLALLLETGAVDESGRLLDSDEIEGEIAERVGKLDGKNVFWLTEGSDGVYLSAADIRKLQLAKSAIAAGIQTLLEHAGLTEDQVESFVLAGGFGSFMDKSGAARIGLFPKSFLPVTQTVGNTASEGAALALFSGEARETLADMRRKCEYVELSTSAVFNNQFVENMTFDT